MCRIVRLGPREANPLSAALERPELVAAALTLDCGEDFDASRGAGCISRLSHGLEPALRSLWRIGAIFENEQTGRTNDVDVGKVHCLPRKTISKIDPAFL